MNALGTGGLRGGEKVRDTQTTVKNLSQVVTLGGKYRLFFPLLPTEEGQAPDIITAIQPGRKLDKDVFKKTFIKIDNYEVTDGGKVIDKTGLDSYNRMSRVLHAGAEAAEKLTAERDATTAAEDLGAPLDQAALAMSLKKITTNYEGDSEQDPPVYAKINPIVGGVVIEIATECLVVPLDATGAPKWKDARLASVSLSRKKSSQLIELLDNPSYCRVEDGFLEVGYSYTGTDKKAAGMNASFQNISKDMSVKVMFPNMEKERIAAMDLLAKDADIIKGRNYNMSSSMTPEEVISSFKSYCKTHTAAFTNIDYEADATKFAAKDFLETGVASDYKTVIAKLAKLVETDDEVVAEVSVEEDTDKAAKEAAVATAGMDALREVSGAVDIDGVSATEAEDLDSL